ncbi:glutathione S-transferase N-terminal domain-containing protein [Candidatus Woesearchaeota archaeon]|nr:glutathione S-transferase N-terminal domain-containing protein [Candidatus Woesearchaeota archaeon]
MAVTVYSTNSCPWCVKAKDFLKQNHVTFKEVNVAEDMKGLQEMEEKSGQRGVPVIDANGTIIVGFDRDGLKAALKIK